MTLRLVWGNCSTESVDGWLDGGEETRTQRGGTLGSWLAAEGYRGNRALSLAESLNAPLAAHGHRLVGQTPLLLGIEACMGRLGGKYFHAVNVCISSVRRDKNF